MKKSFKFNLKVFKHSFLRAAYIYIHLDRTFKRLSDVVVSPILSPWLNTSCVRRHFLDMWQSWVGLKILRNSVSIYRGKNYNQLLPLHCRKVMNTSERTSLVLHSACTSPVWRDFLNVRSRDVALSKECLCAGGLDTRLSISKENVKDCPGA